jgi:hypothetical protein
MTLEDVNRHENDFLDFIGHASLVTPSDQGAQPHPLPT